MTQLPEAEQEKIAEQVADFKKVKSKLDAEIEIWDDTSNDIIVLAKKMCMIMMEMTDFTRYLCGNWCVIFIILETFVKLVKL